MALAPFFDRIYSAVGGRLAVSRDDLTRSLEGVTVGIKCAPHLSENDAWIAELTTNLLARLYPRIVISGGSGERVASLTALAQQINPDIEVATDASNELSVGIGEEGSGASIIPSASGWVATMGGRKSRKNGPANPYAAGVAASLAAGELFRRVFLRSSSGKCTSVSLLSFDEATGSELELPASTIGHVLFVAVGAVGNAAIWALARDHRRAGHLLIIDHEQLELSNLQRYLLSSIEDVSSAKVLLAKRALDGSAITADTLSSTLESFAEMHNGITIPTVCISVDNVSSRRNAQALLAKLIINGWTGDKALGASWHVFSREAACLACLYQPHGEAISQTEQAARAFGFAPDRAALLWVTRLPLSENDIATAADKLGISREALGPWRGKPLGDLYTDVVCGAAPVNLPIVGRAEIVPLAHQSALAGFLMAAELVKRTTPQLESLSQPEPLVSYDDILRQPPEVWRRPRSRENGCICRDATYQSVYRDKWKISHGAT